MRSSNKNRSRNKSSRKSIGNIVNRVFDSSGPEGKVRGTPQQIIEKYTTLSRDAQTSGDRVAAENFMQHAEHYIRMLSEAQREMGVRPENGQGGQHASSGQDDQPRDDSPLATFEEDSNESGLVDTPESSERAPEPVAAEEDAAAAAPKPRTRAPRRRTPRKTEAKSDDSAEPEAASASVG
ncbi:DUF4167 domain-containing protein [Paroceanicella profunda]|uniref:DUF4167 domain-containing protein n=1 Tax=Paroceanicella profunda TaxID=2579971 RepID=A0A5B8FYP4_9RHOB|nr:DUF4167 domain-containing protein [Paroceanicella profunda]QDL92500.1 DUF4167 domain-containing protein [Paroceanicella profunda]